MSLEKAVTTASLRRVLRFGKANGKTAKTLVFELDTTERAVRNLTDDLIAEGVPVCAHPKYGYFIAQTEEEMTEAADFLRERGLHSLKKSSDIRTAFYNFTQPTHPQGAQA